jgi:hypothetical protein
MSATVWPVVQPRMIDDDECEAVGGIKIGRGNKCFINNEEI